MIIWLASYPRSGNTLLRTLLHKCFGLVTYSDGLGVGNLKNVDGVGVAALDTDWDSFYPKACVSGSALSLVKTHKYPRDDYPALYIYRDGRMAIQSYFAFHRDFINTSAPKPLLSLVLGDDYYGGWSDHYTMWAKRTAPTLFLRFEDLVLASPELIQKIGDFIGIAPVSANWVNPLPELQRQNPDLFRSGLTSWKPDGEWNEDTDLLFKCLHGDLMVDLGYLSRESIDSAKASMSPSQQALLTVSSRLSTRCAHLQFHCDERLRVIKALSS